MADLPETGISVMNALIGAPLAWQTPAQVATALGCDLEETLDLLCDLDAAGWLDVWDDPRGLVVTLSPLAAERLCVRIVEVGPAETPRWAGSGDPDPPALRSRSVCASDRAAGLDFVVDPYSFEDFLSQEDPPEPPATSSNGSRTPFEFRPTLLVGLGLTPWPGPAELSKPACPACSGQSFRTCMYCLYCDRWGQDRPPTIRLDGPSQTPPISQQTREFAKKIQDDQAQLERQRARRKSKRRRKRARTEPDRAVKGNFSSPTPRGDPNPAPKAQDLGLAGPPKAASRNNESAGIAGRSAR